MKISKVIIKDFKRFKNLTINLGETPARIIALVGANGCGKSSVLDAFLAKVSNFHKTIGKTEYFHGIHDGKVKGDSIFYHGSLDYRRKNDCIDIIFSDGKRLEEINQENYNLRSVFSFRSPYRYNTDLKVREIKSVEPIKSNSYGASSSIMLDRRIEDNYRNLLAYFNNYRDSNDKKPSEAREEILGRLNESIKNCLDLEISSLGNVEGDKGTLYFKKSDSEQEFEFDCLSAGEKEVVDLLLDLFLRSEDYSNSVFLFDEPELHINTSIQRKLLQEINRLVGESGQIWIATHSIGFLRALQDDFPSDSQIIKFDPSKNNFSIDNVILEPMEKVRNNWQSIFKTALDDLTGLIAPKRIIYCEGRAEPKQGSQERGMDAKVFNNIFNKKYPESLFVSSGGNTELDQRSTIAMAILGKVFPDLDIWVFKDRDIASGKGVSEEQRIKTLENCDSSLRIMKRWEIENYLFDKEVLKAYCQNENLSFNEEKYDSLTVDKDIYNDDYKKLGCEISKACGLPQVSQDRFKENLSKYITEEMEVYKELEDCIFNRK